MKIKFAFVIVLVLTACASPAPTQQTIYVVITATPEEVPAVPSAEPSRTPIPTPVREQEPVLTELEYLEATFQSSEIISAYFGQQTELLELGRENSDFFFMDSWKDAFLETVDQIYAEMVVMASRKSPPKYTAVVSYFVKAKDEYALAREDYRIGLEDQDASALERASAHVENTTRYIAMATAELKRLKN